jgi:hypothetical protein
LPRHLGPPKFEEFQKELSAIARVQSTIRKDQIPLRKNLNPVMELLQNGPLSVNEALKLGLVDGLWYHQDLLTVLVDSGYKTWSLRRYADANIVNAWTSEFDYSKRIIPQLFGRDKKHKKVEKEGKLNCDLSVAVEVVSEKGDTPKIDDAVIKLDVVVPRNVGLIYLDNEIIGCVSCCMGLILGEESLAVKRWLHIC